MLLAVNVVKNHVASYNKLQEKKQGVSVATAFCHE